MLLLIIFKSFLCLTDSINQVLNGELSWKSKSINIHALEKAVDRSHIYFSERKPA
ncbi:hypothetical protein BGX38DRAFT_1168621 [Terfezia claveryi]|nr:hypothetical protein BGX38DRAFT_1168621 [Terfezia claveryi]